MSLSLTRVPRGLLAAILSLVCLSSGAATALAEDIKAVPKERETPLEVVEALFTTLHQKPFNAIRVADLFDQSYVDHTRPENSVIKGTDRSAMLQFLAMLHYAVPDGVYTVDRIASMGDGRVLVSWYFEGTQAIQLVNGQLRAKKFRIQAVEIFRVEGTRITELWRVDSYAQLPKPKHHELPNQAQS